METPTITRPHRGITPWWSPSQLARRYNVTRQTIYVWIDEGKIPPPTAHPSGQGYYWLEGELPSIGKGGQRERG